MYIIYIVLNFGFYLMYIERWSCSGVMWEFVQWGEKKKIWHTWSHVWFLILATSSHRSSYPGIHVSMYPYIHESHILVSLYLCIHVFTYPGILVFMYPCIHISWYPCIYVSMYPCIHISFYPGIHISMYPHILVFMYSPWQWIVMCLAQLWSWGSWVLRLICCYCL